jgi:hypothetical protein
MKTPAPQSKAVSNRKEAVALGLVLWIVVYLVILYFVKPGLFTVMEWKGEVPPNGTYNDWQLAQSTTWWGQPLDPKKFWKDRVLWCDGKAVADAQRHGRLYPPMPYEDSSLSPYPDDEGIHEPGVIDGANIAFASSSKEAGFWDKFGKTHPRPPAELEQKQIDVESEIIESQRDPIPAARKSDYQNVLKKGAMEMGYPPEEFETEALFWAGLIHLHKGIDELAEAGQKPVSDSISLTLTNRRPSAEQIKRANAWKIAYLQRLRRENTDQQYIQAYLKAWNIHASELEGSR